MNLYGQIIGGVRSAVKALAGEKVKINGTEIDAIVNEEDSAISLGIGAMNTERALVIQFESGLVTIDPKGRNMIEARGKKWQISSDEGAVKIGGGATTLTLIEPERRNEL